MYLRVDVVHEDPVFLDFHHNWEYDNTEEECTGHYSSPPRKTGLDVKVFYHVLKQSDWGVRTETERSQVTLWR